MVPKAEGKAVGGAGFKVKATRDCGLFCQNFSLGLLEHPDCVGWHCCSYSGENELREHGIVDQDYHPLDNLLQLMGELNQQIYPLVDYFAGLKNSSGKREERKK